jgi:hypothetical protein
MENEAFVLIIPGSISPFARLTLIKKTVSFQKVINFPVNMKMEERAAAYLGPFTKLSGRPDILFSQKIKLLSVVLENWEGE